MYGFGPRAASQASPPPPIDFGHPSKIGFLDVSDDFKQKKNYIEKFLTVGFGDEPNST